MATAAGCPPEVEADGVLVAAPAAPGGVMVGVGPVVAEVVAPAVAVTSDVAVAPEAAAPVAVAEPADGADVAVAAVVAATVATALAATVAVGAVVAAVFGTWFVDEGEEQAASSKATSINRLNNRILFIEFPPFGELPDQSFLKQG